MLNCEFVLYEYLMATVAGGMDMLAIMKEVLTGKNRIFNKYVSVTCKAKRMSGEMNTSLGNGFSNLMFMTYVCEQLGLECNGVVEGDDGLFVFVGRAPTTADFSKYGFNIKLEKHEQLCTASFCGNVFDEDDQSIITDPYYVFATFSWMNAKYLHARLGVKKSLLRCKALSLAHQYPGCPIIGKLAQYALRMTKTYDVSQFIRRSRTLATWDREQLFEAQAAQGGKRDTELYVEPGIKTRITFETLYGISPAVQIDMERYLDSLTELVPLDLPMLADYVPEDWITYSDNYVVQHNATFVPYWYPLHIEDATHI
jgi:hypothetical protein